MLRREIVDAVAPRLSIPFEHHDNLVLEGLYRISQSLHPADP